MKFTLNEDPIPQCRHRTVRRKNKNINYDPLSSRKRTEKLNLARYAMLDPYIAYKDFYDISMTFFFAIPKSDSKACREKKLSGEIQHTVKPDIDNLIKFILDSMNGVFFSDDKKVVKIQSEKKWAETGRIEIEINGFNMR